MLRKVFGLFIVIIFGVTFYWLLQCRDFASSTLVSYDFHIKAGDKFSAVYDEVITPKSPPPGFYQYLVRVKQINANLKLGYYSAINDTIENMLFRVMNGKESTVKVTFPEGYNIYDMAKLLELKNITNATDFLDAVRNQTLIKTLLNGEFETMEGYLYPDTYLFYEHTKPESIIRRLFEQFKNKFMPLKNQNAFADVQAEYGLSLYQLITLASIVQKETFDKSEMPNVASVFLNRLKINMRLQTDPTIIYGIYRDFDGDIKNADLTNKTNPYNTYVHYGLPPTPICSPSIEAISAVAYPNKTKYLYFVANKQGKHNFAADYKEHLENVQKLLQGQ